jgi:hypothetical protein
LQLKHLAGALGLALALQISTPARAGVYSDDMGKCMVSSTTPEEKHKLVQWIFFAISLNPSITPFANITAEQRDAADKDMAKLFEKLLGESCLKETKDAVKYEGNTAFAESFKLLGEVAGQEIFSSPEVSVASAKFTKYLDVKGLQEKLGIPAK